MLCAYLDWNIIVSIVRGERPDLLRRLVAARDAGRVMFPYSSAHVEEANRIEDAERRAEHIEVATEVFVSTYWEFTAGRIRTRNLPPSECAHTLESRERPRLRLDPRNLVSFVPDRVAQTVHAAEGLGPNHLNKLAPDEIFPYLADVWPTLSRNEDTLSAWERVGVENPGWYRTSRVVDWVCRPFRPWILRAVSDLEWNISKVQEMTRTDDPRDPAVVAGLDAMLDAVGYFSDKRKRGRHGGLGRMWDSRHMAFAQHADVFVSMDRRLRRRAAAVYSYNGTDTEIADVDEFLEMISSDARTALTRQEAGG